MLPCQRPVDMIQAHLLNGELLHCLLCYKLSAFQSVGPEPVELADIDSLSLHLFALHGIIRHNSA
jgi:hypothetical protein